MSIILMSRMNRHKIEILAFHLFSNETNPLKFNKQAINKSSVLNRPSLNLVTIKNKIAKEPIERRRPTTKQHYQVHQFLLFHQNPTLMNGPHLFRTPVIRRSYGLLSPITDVQTICHYCTQSPDFTVFLPIRRDFFCNLRTKKSRLFEVRGI